MNIIQERLRGVKRWWVAAAGAACGQGQWKVGRQAHRSHGRASAPGGEGGGGGPEEGGGAEAEKRDKEERGLRIEDPSGGGRKI